MVIGVFNLTGMMIQSAQESPHAEFQLDISSLPSGIYFVRLTTESGSALRKLAVERNQMPFYSFTNFVRNFFVPAFTSR